MPSDHERRRRGRAFTQTFLRSYLVGSCFNPRGYQSVGVTFAMYPGLEYIHGSPEGARQAARRYVKHFNTHPFWVPCMMGILLNAETLIVKGQLPPEVLAKVKDTTSYTLSAIGDSVFAGSLLIFWALASICLLLAGFRALPLCLGLSLFLGLQAFRLATFLGGLRHGLAFLNMLGRLDLINWGQRIKMVNAALLVCLWVLAWPGEVQWGGWLVAVVGMALAARLFAGRRARREVVITGYILALAAAPWVVGWVRGLIP
ncbi:MAG: PTS system mannose/fructose/sorbose family transporter subunit IID [Desulfovibrionaceae bacterium]